MKQALNFSYDPQTHTTTCERRVRDTIFIGVAQCHPQDYDFENKLTGEHYSYMRSVIKEMQETRKQYKQQLKILHHLYTLFEQNENIDLNSKECYYVRKQIENVQKQLDFYKEMITAIKTELKNTISKKDELYVKLRKKRMGDN